MPCSFLVRSKTRSITLVLNNHERDPPCLAMLSTIQLCMKRLNKVNGYFDYGKLMCKYIKIFLHLKLNNKTKTSIRVLNDYTPLEFEFINFIPDIYFSYL